MFHAMFEIPGEPKAKQSGRLGTVPDAHSKTGFRAIMFPDKDVKQWQNLVVMAGRSVTPLVPLAVPLRVEVVATFARPKNLTERYKDGRLKNGALEGRMYYDQKPDGDNVLKGIKDSLQQAGFCDDDKRFVVEVVCRYYVAIGEAPAVTVEIEELDASDPV